MKLQGKYICKNPSELKDSTPQSLVLKGGWGKSMI